MYDFFLIIFFCYGSCFLIGSQELDGSLSVKHVLDNTVQVMPCHPFTLSLDAVNAELKRAEAIKDFMNCYPWVQKGFYLLLRHDVQVDSFYETVNKLLIADIADDNNVFYKDGLEFPDIIDEVVKKLFAYMKKPFLEALIDALEKNQNQQKLNWHYLHSRYHYKDIGIDRIFHYVLDYKNRYMKDTINQWIKDWFEDLGEMLLVMLIEPKNLNKILFLLNLPVDISQSDDQNRTMLLIAIHDENIEILKEILERIKNDSEHLNFILNQSDNEGFSPLDYAVLKNNKRIVQLLLDAGAAIDWKDGYDNPLHIAALHGYKDMITELLWRNPAIVNIRDSMNRTPLDLVLFNNGLDRDSQLRQESIEVLLSFGAKVDTFWNGYTPLHLAAGFGCYNIAQILLQSGADANIRFNNSGIETPLWSVALHDNVSIDMMLLLLEHGAVINNDIDEQGLSLLGHVLNYPDIVELLLQNGADVNLVDLDEGGIIEMPLLHKAVITENIGSINILLDYGADVDAVGGINCGTALHEAAQVGNAAIVQLLLKHGASRLIINEQGIIPLHVAQDQLFNLNNELKKAVEEKRPYQVIQGLQDKIQVTMPAIIGMLS